MSLLHAAISSAWSIHRNTLTEGGCRCFSIEQHNGTESLPICAWLSREIEAQILLLGDVSQEFGLQHPDGFVDTAFDSLQEVKSHLADLEEENAADSEPDQDAAYINEQLFPVARTTLRLTAKSEWTAADSKDPE